MRPLVTAYTHVVVEDGAEIAAEVRRDPALPYRLDLGSDFALLMGAEAVDRLIDSLKAARDMRAVAA